MTKRWTRLERFAAVALSLLVTAASASQSAKTVVGSVASFDRDTLVLKTDSGDTVTLRLGPETEYAKWVTQKPWQRSTTASWSFLGVGKRVAVKPAGPERPNLAKLVRIATE